MTTNPKTTRVPKPPIKTVKYFNRSRLLFAGLLAVLFVIIGSVIYWRVSYNQAVESEKKNFAQANKDINEIMNNIAATLGEPLRKDDLKSCSKPNQKLDTGSLTCQVGSVIFYSAPDLQAANRLANLISNVVSEQNRSDVKMQYNYFNTNLSNDDLYEVHSNKLNLNSTVLKCTKTLSLYSGNNPPLRSYPKYLDQNVAVLSLSCSGHALKYYY